MSYKVLIADDELIIRKGIVKLISSFDLPLEIAPQAKNGVEMLEITETFKPDIIIADINMPLLNGLEAIGRICEENRDLAFIIVSGYDKFEYAQKAIDLGVLAYLLKPFSNDEFRDVLQKAIEFRRDRDSVRAIMGSGNPGSSTQEDLLQYISRNYCNAEMSLSFLEEKFSLGRTTIGNTIRKKTGMTPVNYINHLRIEHSKILMKDERTLSISAIADLLGFSNQHYFSRVFRQYCGLSPSEYRSSL